MSRRSLRCRTPFPCPFGPSAHRLTCSSLPQYCHGRETISDPLEIFSTLCCQAVVTCKGGESRTSQDPWEELPKVPVTVIRYYWSSMGGLGRFFFFLLCSTRQSDLDEYYFPSQPIDPLRMWPEMENGNRCLFDPRTPLLRCSLLAALFLLLSECAQPIRSWASA